MNQEDEWVRADTLASRWELSPYDVIDILDGGQLPFRRVYGWGTPTIWTLNEAEVHIIDLNRWEKLYLENERATRESGDCSPSLRPQQDHQMAEPIFETPENVAADLKAILKNTKSSDRKQKIVQVLDERFPGLSQAQIGKLLADEGESLDRDACIQRTKRARNPQS